MQKQGGVWKIHVQKNKYGPMPSRWFLNQRRFFRAFKVNRFSSLRGNRGTNSCLCVLCFLPHKLPVVAAFNRSFKFSHSWLRSIAVFSHWLENFLAGKALLLPQERVQSVPFTGIQHSRYPVSLLNLPRAHGAARHSKCKTVSSRVFLFPASTKQMPAGLDFAVENEFTGSFTEFPTDPALPGT